MPRTKLHDLSDIGQSIWLDYISRSMLDKGELDEWISRGLRGLTSNPSIFNQAIAKSADYDESIAKLKAEGRDAFAIYDTLSIKDIQDAADRFLPLYESSSGLDGYVSLEINPRLANDTAASVAEGERLFAAVNRPNCMIKVPATPAGFPVVEALIGQGINVNVTLIFSPEQYHAAARAYCRGLEQLLARGGNPSRVRSVASVFVSRVDAAVDAQLQALNADEALQGQSAVANCGVIFGQFGDIFESDAFSLLKDQGSYVQRVLWGSTSTKNPAYSDVKYVEELIASPTVNTVPEPTIKAYLDHGEVRDGLTYAPDAARKILKQVSAAGVDMPAVYQKLLDDGVEAFVTAFDQLLTAIEEKANQLCSS